MKSSQPKFIKQYAADVIDFSSQYGGENPRSVSYSVTNIIGEPRIFPSYGDFTQAAVFRTYGPWWNGESKVNMTGRRPSAKTFHGKDYIDLLFEEAVYPWSIAIYETYNPGGVVRILALKQAFPVRNSGFPNEEGQPIPLPFSAGCTDWKVLWECTSPEQNLPNVPNESRMFAPILNEMKCPTRIIRLEFCSMHLQYYTEIDAVELTGTSTYCPSTPVDPPTNLLETLCLFEHDEKKHCLEKHNSKKNYKRHYENGYFDLLPPELMRYIFSFLPLTDLCRCSRVSRLFHELSYDPSQFTDIDLSGCWHVINDDALSGIISHCNPRSTEPFWEDSKLPPTPQVQTVDLSWCGGGGIVSKGSLVRFVENCSSECLTRLTLASSPAVSDEVLRKIAFYCPNLAYLDIQSCDAPSSEGLRVLHNLTKLQTANFYRTKIDDAGVICIIHSNPSLKNLNLGSCLKIQDYDRVLLELSQYCPKLHALDCWRAKSLTSQGLNALTTSCNYIEELDLGWCGGLQSLSGCFQTLAYNCQCLRKLYVTANRTMSDTEINALARNCPRLQKLDILGTRLVTVPAITNLLDSCKNLAFLDVSFCFAFTKEVVDILQEQYPNVSIKRSFQEES